MGGDVAPRMTRGPMSDYDAKLAHLLSTRQKARQTLTRSSRRRRAASYSSTT